MKLLEGKNILFFCAKFFSYEEEVVNSLKELGAQVSWYDERPSNSFLTKILIRINKKILKFKIDRYYENITSSVAQQKNLYDYILIISPEAMSAKNLKKIKNINDKAKIILYMWDSFQNKGALDLIPLVDTAFTFDPDDARKYKIQLRPLFYLESYKHVKREELFDLLFIGTVHSDRYTLVKKIVKQIETSYRVKLHFYLSSRFLFFSKKVFDKNFSEIKYNEVCFTSLSHKENSELIHNSKMILDINHPKQIGLTMRTFETLGAQKKLITTNRDIINYDFYNKENILVIDRLNPIIPKEFLQNSFIPLKASLMEKYSVKGWLKELFDI